MSGTAYGPPSPPSPFSAPPLDHLPTAPPPAPAPSVPDVPPYPGPSAAPPFPGPATAPVQPAAPGPAPLSRAAARAERARAGGPASLAVQGLPSRRLVTMSLAGAVAAGSALGLVIGVFAPGSPDGAPTGTSAAATATGAASPTRTAGASTSPSSPSATPSASLTVETTTADAQAPPGGFIDNPQDDKSLRLGTIQSVERSSRGLAVWITPDKIKDGQIQQSGGQATRYLLRDDATIFLADFGGQDPHQVGLDQAAGMLTFRLGIGQHPVVWFKRAYGAVGPVVYLAEQKTE